MHQLSLWRRRSESKQSKYQGSKCANCCLATKLERSRQWQNIWQNSFLMSCPHVCHLNAKHGKAKMPAWTYLRRWGWRSLTGDCANIQIPDTRLEIEIFNTATIRMRASNEMFFSARSTSPTYLGFKPAFSPSCSWVKFTCLRYWRIACPSNLRCLMCDATFTKVSDIHFH